MTTNPAVENGAPVPKLTRMELVYQLEGQDPATAVIHNRSLIAWDETRGVRKWGTSQESPFLFQTFILWHHLHRTGQYPSDFNTFRDVCIGCEAVDDEDGEPLEVPVDPTQPTVTPDLSSPLE
ncbi:hypothetical protein [Aeromicrobium sp. 9AM]|uniref:hypothetical protein n=1 Tax=Aeromicrobium sp. 9AM TaxID=2653126 RepID=UPI0012F087BE|nr:hypothetical protein [Aeromicrobium sp. 9AM]VXC21290.1 hypothetical protein AERO9AM_50380 [Aeromicrobium sp. 9AM]